MKLNRLRNIALGLVFFGLVIMCGGIYFRTHQLIIGILFVIGALCCLISVVLYFYLGMISMRLPQVECPSCKRITKMMGTTDNCMYCKAPVSILDSAMRD